MDAEDFQEIWRVTPNPPALFNFQFWSILLGYHFGDIERAKKNIKAMRKDLFEDGPTMNIPPRLLYTGLVYLALFRKSRKIKYRIRARGACKQLQKWGDQGAVHCTYMCRILQAEDLSCRRKSSVEATMAAFDKAIRSVSDLGLIHHMALANELATTYLLSQNQQSRASPYLDTALELYQRWGAVAIVSSLTSRFRGD